jgi:hypothetical protein
MSTTYHNDVGDSVDYSYNNISNELNNTSDSVKDGKYDTIYAASKGFKRCTR